MAGSVATSAFANAIADLVAGYDYIGTGIGTTDPVIGDTTLENTTGAPARVQGTVTQPSANIHQVVATVSYVSTLAITEAGLFSALTSGTMAGRSTFASIGVESGDSIQFTAQTTITPS